MSTNYFLKPEEYYQRDLNPIKSYVEQAGFYLSKTSGKPLDFCMSVVSDKFKTNQFPDAKDPRVNFLHRNEVGDKFQEETRLSTYIREVNQNQEVLAPTFTSYLPTSTTESLIVGFIDRNVKRRSISKKQAFEAKAQKKMDLYQAKDNEQANMKLYNNSMSGTFATAGSVLHNPTGHSTLTSITRTESSVSNASNEKIISGNRHYFDDKVTLNNLVFIASKVDREALSAVINKYNLKYPTIQDTIDCVLWSTSLYWTDIKRFQPIADFISVLDDIERAAIVYGGDLYHIRVHNESFVRNFIQKLSTKVKGVKYDDPFTAIKSIDEMIINYGHQICMDELRGFGKDYSKMPIDDVCTLVATCKNIESLIIEHKDFIDAIFLTKNIPSTTAHIRSMVRRSVVLSDTDSTMFSIDEWVKWYFGEVIFTPEAFAVAGAVMYIATQCISHCLAQFSANLGVERKKLFMIQMKPEMVFVLHSQTSVAKHYFSCIVVKEGNVFHEPEMEIKGVHLKNSAAPKVLIKASQKHMETITNTIVSGKKLSIVEELKRVGDIERNIISSLLNGDVAFYKKTNVKPAAAYSLGPERSPYQNHLFWQEIWAPKYGNIEDPPYEVIKVPVTLDNRTKLRTWVGNIEDEELRNRFNTWLVKTGKSFMGTFYLPMQYIISSGIPKEIKSVINVKKVALDLTLTDRMILETIGYYPKTDWLISEMGY